MTVHFGILRHIGRRQRVDRFAHSTRSTRALCVAATVSVALAAVPSAAPAQSDSGAARAPSFFDSEAPVELRLTANFDALRRDKSEDPEWRTASVTYRDPADSSRSRELPARLRPRGIWRRAHCTMPPLRLDLPKRAAEGTPFAGLDRPKLVSFCQDNDRGEQYILQELQLYRIYALLSPVGHRARLLRITYADSGSGRVRATRYAILVEEPDAMAKRLGGEMVDAEVMAADWLDARSRTLVGMFQYFIGNHDWSISGMHNVEVLNVQGTMHPVPYDFDFSGAVGAWYATPPPQVPVRTVRQRYYRGDCAPDSTLSAVLDLFRERRSAIRASFDDDIGRLMKRDVAKRMTDYLDEFYRTIDDRGAVARLIVARCSPQ